MLNEATSSLRIVPVPVPPPTAIVARVVSTAPANKALLRLTWKSSSRSTMSSSVTVTVTLSVVSTESPLIVKAAPPIAV